MMRLAFILFPALVVSACSTVSQTRLAAQKGAIEAQTRPGPVMDCHCPTVNPKTGEYDGMMGSFRVADGDFGDYPETFGRIIADGVPFSDALELYANEISDTPEDISETSKNCWSGTCSIRDYFISDLKDVTKTWVYLSEYPKSYAHKCTFAEDPNAWTTEPCPKKGHVG